MTLFSVRHFDNLKQLLLEKSGYEDLSPADCKALALVVFKITNMQISETTLKRVYGFAFSKFKPSLFTLNAMAKFCGFTGWANFCSTDEKNHSNSNCDACWENIKISAHKITGFTLQVLKNRSGIPYNQTISRKFADDHFSAFLGGNYIATSLVAPAGYGKTLALCHWVEERLQLNETGQTNDIILFFSSSALINIFLSGKDINEWMLSLLGYGTESDFSTLLDSNEKHDGNFYLIVDGLDEHMFKNDQFELLFDQILDIFSFYQFHDSFRLILTMRTATWINHRFRIENLKDKWFDGFVTANDEAFNVPLFNIAEIRNLCVKINPAIQNFVGIEVAENFKHPLYFQFYYQQHKHNFSLNNVDHVCVYELISVFILNKIYLGPQAIEKTLIVKELIEAMDFTAHKLEVHKYVLNDITRKYNSAYNDLLGIGFIREVNKSADMQYNAVIQFCNENFLNYSIARALLFKHGNLFDLELINKINLLFDSPRRLQLLKWCILYAFKNGQYESFNFLAETRLAAHEKSDLILFLGDMLEKARTYLNKTEAMSQYFKQEANDNLFNYFFGLELINGMHKKTLQTLLKFDLSPEKKRHVYIALAMIAIKQLDFAKIDEQITNLKRYINVESQGVQIDPLSCMETIYYYCKYGVLKKDAIAQLTKFYFLPPNALTQSVYKSTDEMIHLLGLYTLVICTTPFKVIRYIHAIEKSSVAMSTNFRLILMTNSAEAYFALNKVTEAQGIYVDILNFYEREKGSFTPFAETLFYALKAKVQVYNNGENIMEVFIKLLTSVSKQPISRIIQLQTLSFILNNKAVLNASDTEIKSIQYEFKKLMRESDFSEEAFQKYAAASVA